MQALGNSKENNQYFITSPGAVTSLNGRVWTNILKGVYIVMHAIKCFKFFLNIQLKIQFNVW